MMTEETAARLIRALEEHAQESAALRRSIDQLTDCVNDLSVAICSIEPVAEPDHSAVLNIDYFSYPSGGGTRTRTSGL